MCKPLISIITVCFNCKSSISKTIESVLGQTYSNIEYIIVDGASTDGTKNILDKFSRCHPNRIRLISEKDAGIYDAMNKGINLSKGVLIGIVNSGDWYESNAVENITNEYKKNPSADIFYGLTRYIAKDGSELNVCRFNHDKMHIRMIDHVSSFVKKSVYDKYGLYDTSYQSAADYDLFIQFKLNGCQFIPINQIISNFPIGGISSSMRGALETFKIRYKYKMITTVKYKYKLVGILIAHVKSYLINHLELKS